MTSKKAHVDAAPQTGPAPENEADLPAGPESMATTSDGALTNVPCDNGQRVIDPGTGTY